MATASSSSVASIQIDVTPLKRLARDLRAAAPAAAKEMRLALRSAGEIVATEARVEAPDVKEPIPPSIKVRTVGTTVKVVAGGADAPAAAAFENGGQDGRFFHPVFGTHVWVPQKAHPFLAPAFDATATEVEAAVTDAIRLALESAGFGLE